MPAVVEVAAASVVAEADFTAACVAAECMPDEFTADASVPAEFTAAAMQGEVFVPHIQSRVAPVAQSRAVQAILAVRLRVIPATVQAGATARLQ
jgi:hypothetical protein